MTVARQARHVDVFTACVELLREFIELLRAIRQSVEEDGAALDADAVIVEARVRARVDRRIGGVASDARANSRARFLERYTRSSLRMRAYSGRTAGNFTIAAIAASKLRSRVRCVRMTMSVS